MAGRFEIWCDKAGEYRWRLKAGNGQTILVGEGHLTKSALHNCIESVRKNAQIDGRFQRKLSKSGQPIFNLLAGNSQTIGTSDLYQTEAGRENAILSVRKNAPHAETVDLTQTR